MHLIILILFLCFVHVTLLIPGYGFIKQSGLFSSKRGIELCAAYLLTLFIFGLVSMLGYAGNTPRLLTQALLVLYVLGGGVAFFINKAYRDVWQFRFPLTSLFVMSLFSLLFVQLTFKQPYHYIPDPQPVAGYHYSTIFDVKILNISQTNANDNSIPYRQAQFIVNRSDPAKDSFIDEWGVTFFQRTPLMGSVVASYFTLMHEKLPIAYIWSPDSPDPRHTYQQFQAMASVLNTLFIVPAYFLFIRFFGKRNAQIALLLIIPSQFFLYNSFFTWPKSLVAFFVLFSWHLLFEKRFRYLVLAGVASGLAYLTHDLAVLYLSASLLLLLYFRRFKDLLIFLALNVVFFLPWFVTSAIIYKKPSSFIYYPISVQGIPQYSDRARIIQEFKQTSLTQLIYIRLHSLLYLLSPYQLIFSEGGQPLSRRIWALGAYSIPGAVGIGLIPASIIELFKRRKFSFWILVLTPVIASVLVIGWQDGLGAMHFAEAVVVLLIGLGVSFLTRIRQKAWLYLAYTLSVAQLIFLAIYDYNYSWRLWLRSPHDLIILAFLLTVIGICGLRIISLTSGSPTLSEADNL